MCRAQDSVQPGKRARRNFLPTWLTQKPVTVPRQFLKERSALVALGDATHRRGRIDLVVGADETQDRAADRSRRHLRRTPHIPRPMHDFERCASGFRNKM